MKHETFKAVQGVMRSRGQLPVIPSGRVFKSKKKYDRKAVKRELYRMYQQKRP